MQSRSTRVLTSVSMAGLMLSCGGTATLGFGEETAELGAAAAGTGSSASAVATSSAQARASCDLGARLCESTPLGRLVPYATRAELEALAVGLWQDCDGTLFPSKNNAGLQIAADHTWRVLEVDHAGECRPVRDGFDGFGTWQATEDEYPELVLNGPLGGGVGFHPLFADDGRMRLGNGGSVFSEYVRLSGEAADRIDTNARAESPPTAAPTAIVRRPDGSLRCDLDAVLCASTPLGRFVPYATIAELEALIIGVWQDCDGTAFPSQFGVGLEIAADHTWYPLEAGLDGTCVPMTQGFEGPGTWTMRREDGIPLFSIKLPGGSAGFRPRISDSGRMRLDAGTALSEYVLLSGPE